MFTDTLPVLGIYQSDIETKPNIVIDMIIQQARKNKDAEFINLICTTIAAQERNASCPADQTIDQFVCQLLDDPVYLRTRQLIAVYFLRLLPEPGMEWLHEPPWRPRVIALIEQQAEDFCNINKIDLGMMAHQKIATLIEAMQKFDQDFQRALQTLTSLELMNKHRQRVMKILNGKVGRLLVHPFLPMNVEAQLDELFTRVQNYLDQRDSLGVVDAHTEAIAEIKQFIVAMTQHSTIYSQWFADMVGQRLENLVQDDFASNKAAQPTSVLIQPRDKKYPLHLIDHELHVGFLLHNQGPGYAHNTLLMVIAGENLSIVTDEIEIGRMAPGASQRIEVPSVVRIMGEKADFLLQVMWKNFDGSQEEKEFEFTIQAQSSNIEWAQLAYQDPYSLEPVINEQDLVGRRDVLSRLIATAKSTQAGSSFIQGQKRVGKTSIARALKSHLQDEGFLVAFLEGGDYVEPDAQATVAHLGRSLAKIISRQDDRLTHLPIPEFSEAISPLAEFLDDLHVLLPDKRLIIILDEFDELPADLYARGPFGNSFFLTLRSLSSRSYVGFVLVGGEKMRNIMESQGAQLNKWNVVPVDYFSRETDWIDYQELIQRPVSGTLEYTEDSLNILHEITAGNPYFTKLVCQNIFRTAVDRSDCYITRTEVNDAVNTAVMEAKINTFQHFWEDGLLEMGDKGKEKSVRRRKVLIAVSDTLQKQKPAPKRLISEHRIVRDVATLDSELQEFITRQILVGSIEDEVYDFKVQLFDAWLKARGVQDVIMEFSNLDAALKERQQEEALKVKPTEIINITGRLGLYKGQPISEDKVRAWLEQFETIREKRTMFTILMNLQYFSNAYTRQKMAEVHGIVKRGLVRYLQERQIKRSDILVSYLDNPSKSGARFARLYADEAEIYVGNIVEKGELEQALLKEEIKALVFVDDFVCTGTSVIEYLQELDKKLSDTILSRGIKVVLVAVVAFKGGWQKVEKAIEQLDMPVICQVCELLDEQNQCFSDQSIMFPDKDQRDFAKQVSMRYGRNLEKKWPLGYGDLGLAVVFENSCPNNSLPILWAEDTNWMPLFKRH